MPIKSTGCITCRKRKIRCDEGRPGCQRCATHGVRCPGYQDKPGGIEFRDQTVVTAKRAEERYKAKQARLTGLSKTSTKASGSASFGNDKTELSVEGNGTGSAPESSSEPTQDLAVVPASPSHFHSPGAERTQIYNEFIATYLPKTRQGAQDGHFSFYQKIGLKRSEQPALQQSFDSLSLVQVGSIHKDQRVLKQAVQCYGAALRSLALSISRSDSLHDDDILAAITCLAQCELYEKIANLSEGWARHVQGANELLAARGPDSLQSDLALLLYSNLRHGALLHALISRKAPFMAIQEWRNVSFRGPESSRDISSPFCDIAIQVPGVLQRHDEIDMDSPTNIANIDSILAESKKLEMELRDWWNDWQANATIDNLTDCELRAIDEFPTFASQVADRAFTHAYMFPNFFVGYLYSLYWMVMYHLRTNTQSLHKSRHEAASKNWYPEPDAVVYEDELLGYVLNICQCIPFFVEPMSCSSGHIGVFMPMRTAAFYFTDHGHWAWLKWIGAVRNNVFVKGLAPPTVKKTGRESGIATAGKLLPK